MEENSNSSQDSWTEKDEIFPPKPVEVTKPPSINRSLISLGLFILVFYLVFQWDIFFILILAGVIFIHELGHFLAMKIFDYKELGIFFIPLVGAMASGTKEEISQRQRVIILLAGPIPGVFIGLVLYLIGIHSGNSSMIQTADIFIFLNLFNLLPIMPLDGGRILKSMFFENNEIISRIFILISVVALSYYSITYQSYFLLIIPLFLILQMNAQSQFKKIRNALDLKEINWNKSYGELTNEEYWLIRKEIGAQIKYYSQFITPNKYIVSENEGKILNQVKAVIEKQPVKDLGTAGKVLVTLLWIMAFLMPVMIIIFTQAVSEWL